MSNYWTATNKIPIEQLSVSIPAENGTNHGPTQEVRFQIDPSVKFFNPQESYLEFDVKITPPFNSASNACSVTHTQPCYLTLDAETGAQALIRTVRIRDAQGTLLEEIDGYNTMVAMKYDYHTNESLRNKRSLTEGAQTYDLRSRGTNGTSLSYQNTLQNSQYFTQSACNTETQLSKDNYLNCKVSMPLHTGIFQNSKIFPNMAVGGLQISLLLEDVDRSFRTLDGANKFRRSPLNPFFQSIDGSACNTTGQWGNTALKDEFYLSFENSINAADKVPFAVGEAIGFYDLTAETDVRLDSAAVTDIAPKIKKIGFSATLGVKITLDVAVKPQSGSMAIRYAATGTAPSNFVMFSKSNIQAAQGATPTYNVQNSHLVIQKVDIGAQYEAEMMRKMKEGGTINYDFLSTTNYKYSQLAGDTVANIRLPINNARCKSIIGIPTDATTYTMSQVLKCADTYANVLTTNETDYILNQQRVGLVGCSDFLTDYQFLYDGKLQPSRRVNVSKTSSKESISAQHLIELDKALSQAGITAHSLKEFDRNFCIGRALSLGSGVYDARNRDFNLQLNYNGNAPTKNKLWNFFVFHIRRLEITGDSVRVVV